MNETPPLRIEIAMLPPTVNHLYVQRRNGGRALAPAAQAWYDTAGWAAREAAQGWRCPPGDIAVSVALTFPTRARADIDNRLKAALDAVSRALGFDDQRVSRLLVERVGYGPARTVITLEPAHA